MDATQSTHFTLQATLDFRDVDRALRAKTDIQEHYEGLLMFKSRSGSKVVVLGSEDNLKKWLADMKQRGAISGLVYAGLHANLTCAVAV